MQLGQNSAKIYQFPAGGRTAIVVGRTNAAQAELRAVATPVVDFGCGYHSAAIEEDAARHLPSAEIRPFVRH